MHDTDVVGGPDLCCSDASNTLTVKKARPSLVSLESTMSTGELGELQTRTCSTVTFSPSIGRIHRELLEGVSILLSSGPQLFGGCCDVGLA